MRSNIIVIAIVFSTILVGCVGMYVPWTITEWTANFPFEQGVVNITVGQEKLTFSKDRITPYGSFSIKIDSPDEIKEIEPLISDVRLRLLKNGNTVIEHKIYPEPYVVRENSKIIGIICSYAKYIFIQEDKRYCINWDEFEESIKVSDKMDFSINLKFKANGRIYTIEKTVELQKSTRTEWTYGV